MSHKFTSIEFFGISGSGNYLSLFSEYLPRKNRDFYILSVQVAYALGGIYEVGMAYIFFDSLF